MTDGIEKKTEPMDEGQIAWVMDKIRRPDTRRRNIFSLASDIFARTTAPTSRSEILARIIRDREMRIETGVESPKGDKTKHRQEM